MIYELENFTNNIDVLSEVKSGDKFIECNLCQFEMDTILFKGLTELEFVRCNLINCVLPKDTKTYQCNTAKIEYVLIEEEYEE